MGLVSEKLLPRIPIIEVFPVIEDGTLPAKATEGEPFPIRATVFREGHDAFAAEAVLLRPDGGEYSRTRMVDIAPGLDRYEAWVAPDFTVTLLKSMSAPKSALPLIVPPTFPVLKLTVSKELTRLAGLVSVL